MAKRFVRPPEEIHEWRDIVDEMAKRRRKTETGLVPYYSTRQVIRALKEAGLFKKGDGMRIHARTQYLRTLGHEVGFKRATRKPVSAPLVKEFFHSGDYKDYLTPQEIADIVRELTT